LVLIQRRSSYDVRYDTLDEIRSALPLLRKNLKTKRRFPRPPSWHQSFGSQKSFLLQHKAHLGGGRLLTIHKLMTSNCRLFCGAEISLRQDFLAIGEKYWCNKFQPSIEFAPQDSF
jgi:hypothetical protein